MTLIKFLTVCILSCCSLTGYSQVADSSIYRTQADTVKPHKITNISVGNYFHLLKDDFVQQAEAPFNIRRRQLLRVAGFAVITAAVMRYDEPINHVDLRIVAKSSAVRAISPVVTNFGGKYEVYMIGAIGAWSYLFKNDQLKTATLLATQSYITSGVWVSVLKFVAGRSRPLYFDVHTQEDESIWHGPFFQFKKNSSGKKPDGSEYSSFPSGHTTVAFSVATVYAEMYKNTPWVPIVAYSSASLIGLSRITENKHWASDVLVGSALGYLCGKQVVRNYRRFERLQSTVHKKKNILDFNVNYINRTIMPELIYTFR
jgi:membrane-associated phospholipid phosphatase